MVIQGIVAGVGILLAFISRRITKRSLQLAEYEKGKMLLMASILGIFVLISKLVFLFSLIVVADAFFISKMLLLDVLLRIIMDDSENYVENFENNFYRILFAYAFSLIELLGYIS